MDVYERVPAGDAMQSAAVLAWLVYNAANYPEMMPRKPLHLPEVKK
jgi:carboxypeptidase Q